MEIHVETRRRQRQCVKSRLINRGPGLLLMYVISFAILVIHLRRGTNLDVFVSLIYHLELAGGWMELWCGPASILY